MQAQPVTIARIYDIFEYDEDDLEDRAFNQQMQALEQRYEQAKLKSEEMQKVWDENRKISEGRIKISEEHIQRSCDAAIKAILELKIGHRDQEPEPSKVMETAKKVLLFIFLTFPVIAYKAARSMPSHTRELIAQRFLKRSFEAYDHIV